MDDYFKKINEFKRWLTDKKKVNFEDLSTKESRRYFEKFCKKWNNAELKSIYYDGIKESQTKTTHKWSFTKDKKTMAELEMTKDAVFYATQKGKDGDATGGDSGGSKRNYVSKAERKRFNRDHNAVLDELVPRAAPGTREAMLEKKRAKSNRIHGASRSKGEGM